MKNSYTASTGILLTLFSSNFRKPVRLNNFEKGKISSVISRGQVFGRGRFEIIDNKDKGITELVVSHSNDDTIATDDEEIFYSTVLAFGESSSGVCGYAGEKVKPRNYFINEVLIEVVPENDTEDVLFSFSFIVKPELEHDGILFHYIPEDILDLLKNW